jgi:hypothetical protein
MSLDLNSDKLFPHSIEVNEKEGTPLLDVFLSQLLDTADTTLVGVELPTCVKVTIPSGISEEVLYAKEKLNDTLRNAISSLRVEDVFTTGPSELYVVFREIEFNIGDL